MTSLFAAHLKSRKTNKNKHMDLYGSFCSILNQPMVLCLDLKYMLNLNN